jgi:flagellar hook protein FlgE
MALLRSMSSGISGLAAQQAALDVTGHNIANATTIGYKTGRVNFTSLLSQSLRMGSAPNGGSGGVNPQQVGLGVNVGSIQHNFNDGPRRATGIATDLALEGNGFFVLDGGRGRVFTRDGTFSLNNVGQLVDPSSGYRVQGWMADTNPANEIRLPNGGSDFVIRNQGSVTENIRIPLGELRIARETRNVAFAGNLNSGGDLADMASILESEPLFERVGGVLIPASQNTLLENIVRTSDATPLGTPVELGLDNGATVNLKAQVGGRLVNRTFTVGAPAPAGGNTLGHLRDFIRGGLGIYQSTAPGNEAYSSIRTDALNGSELAHTLAQAGENGYATLTLNGVTAGEAITIGGVTLTAGAEFAIGANDAETAANLATAMNLNPVLASQLVASVVAPSGGPVQVQLSLRNAGPSNLTIDAAPSMIQTTGAIRLGTGSAQAVVNGDQLSFNDGANNYIFEFDNTGSVAPGAIPVAIGNTPAETARNLAAAISASAMGANFSVAARGESVRITDMRTGANAFNSDQFIDVTGSSITNPGAVTFEESNVVGGFSAAGAAAGSFMLGGPPYENGTLPASIRDPNVDYVAAGVQVGDIIRFTTGNLAASIAKVVAVGQRADGTLDRNAITFEFEPDTDIPPAATEALNYYIHEAAGVDIGVQSLVNPNVPPPGQDPSSPAGTLRISGNVGFGNRIEGLELNIKGSRGAQKLTSFRELTSARGESFNTTVTLYDSLGTPRNVKFTFFYEARSDADPAFRYIAVSDDQVVGPGNAEDTVLGSGVVRFDTNGKLMDGPANLLELQLADQGANTPLTFRMDFTGMTSFAAEGSRNHSDVYMTEQDGYEAGTLVDFNIGEDGVVQGLFTNGLVRSIAQVAVAGFANPNGLTSEGANTFSAGVNSGEPNIGAAGQAGRALVRSGYLEESNVELAQEFTNLITSQRAFQANARTISTASQLLQELVNMV